MKITTLIDEKDLLSRDYLSKIKGAGITIDSLDDPDVIEGELPNEGVIDSLDEPDAIRISSDH